MQEEVRQKVDSQHTAWNALMLAKKTKSETYCGWKGGWAAVVGVPTVNG